MLHLVSEQYDFPGDGMEYGLLGPERIAHLDREDLDRYHRSMRTSRFCASMDEGSRSNADNDADTNQETINKVLLQFRDETKSEMAELKLELSDIISLLRDLNNEFVATPVLLTPPASPIEELPACNDLDSSSKTTVADDDLGSESTIKDSSQLLEIPVSNGIISSTTIVEQSIDEENKQNEESDCLVLVKMDDQNNDYLVFDEMTKPILEEDLLSIEVPTAAHYLLDKMPTLFPVDSDEGLYGLITNIFKVSIQGLCNWEDVLGVSETDSPSLPKLGFNPQVFDPGTPSHFKYTECESLPHCICSEAILNYSHVSGKFNAYNHLVIKFCWCLFEWAKSKNIKIDWVLSIWNGWEILLWSCSYLLLGCKGPFILIHAAQICSNFYQAAPRLRYGHDLCVGNGKIHLTADHMLSQRDPFGDENFLIHFSHFCMLNSDSHGVILLIFNSIARRERFSKSLYDGASYMLLSKCLYCWTLSWDKVTNELRLVSSFGSKIDLRYPRRVFICAIFAYILEDKDNFKWVGDSILVMIIIRSSKDDQTDWNGVCCKIEYPAAIQKYFDGSLPMSLV